MVIEEEALGRHREHDIEQKNVPVYVFGLGCFYLLPEI